VSNNWSAPTSWDEVCRRKAGRDSYNSIRRVQRAERRYRVLELLTQYGMDRGVQARIARELGVSRVTISRDVKALLFDHAPCPRCGSFVPRSRLAGPVP
jgi:hypothetical protein